MDPVDLEVPAVLVDREALVVLEVRVDPADLVALAVPEVRADPAAECLLCRIWAPPTMRWRRTSPAAP